MLRAELFLMQRDAQAVRAQFEVMRKREDCRLPQSPAVGMGSSAGTPRSAFAGISSVGGGATAAVVFGPSASSTNTTPAKAPTSSRGVVGPLPAGPYDKNTAYLEEQAANLKVLVVIPKEVLRMGLDYRP